MYSKIYSGKQSAPDRLTQEIIASGKPVSPSTGARFYGVTCDADVSANYRTTVLFFDDITAQEITEVDAIVTAHVPTPLPIVEQPKDAEGKPFVRAESRPLLCTTYFTSAGDTVGATPSIGTGPRMEWDASVSEGWTTSGCPTGFKKKSVEFQFCDSVWLKEGTFYYMNAVKGSMVDVEVLCPNGGYYMYLGQVCQNTTGNDLVVDHYCMKHPIQDDVPMGDELNTEACSQELPSYLKYRLTVTVPTSDELSYGYLELEMYRQRTVVL